MRPPQHASMLPRLRPVISCEQRSCGLIFIPTYPLHLSIKEYKNHGRTIYQAMLNDCCSDVCASPARLFPVANCSLQSSVFQHMHVIIAKITCISLRIGQDNLCIASIHMHIHAYPLCLSINKVTCIFWSQYHPGGSIPMLQMCAKHGKMDGDIGLISNSSINFVSLMS